MRTFLLLLLAIFCVKLLCVQTLPTVTTTVVAVAGKATAIVGGNVTADGGAPVTQRGVVWNLRGTPVIPADNVMLVGSGHDNYTWKFTRSFPPNTTIHLRAFATNSQGTAYGEEVIFTITPPEQTSAMCDFETVSLIH